jgi:hypothetical protein
MVARALCWFLFCLVVMVLLQLDPVALVIASVLSFAIVEGVSYEMAYHFPSELE